MKQPINDGRKIHRSIENPIDNVLIDLATWINPFLHNWIGLTPNILTLYALVTGLFAAYFTWKANFLLAAIFTLISYQFDTLDGNMARMFDMTTSFGDMFDHSSDMLKYTALIAALMWSTHLPFWFRVISVTIVLIFCTASMIHMGCQEKSYSKHNVDSLSILEPMCKQSSWIHVTKWFGVGTNILVLVIILIISHHVKIL